MVLIFIVSGVCVNGITQCFPSNKIYFIAYTFLYIYLYINIFFSYLIWWKECQKCDEITSSSMFLLQPWKAQFVPGTAHSLRYTLCSNLSSTWVITFSSQTNWQRSYGPTFSIGYFPAIYLLNYHVRASAVQWLYFMFCIWAFHTLRNIYIKSSIK